MPAKVKVRIVAGRDLPVMDRASELADAFVEVKFGNTTYKTDVYRKSLNPQWNSEWYRFEVDDEDLQDEPLQIRVLDHDTYSAHDAIGKVYIDLNPLLFRQHASVLNGWLPIYDTMHGIRGELNVIVKVDLFSDINKFRKSSCGVQFFCTPGVPYCHIVQGIHGFVEELVVNDDPEYQWIDKIRSQRASNEARQIRFCKLSGELQRKIGLKVLEMGGNAVIGYQQCFDLEGETGVVVRAIGTAVSLAKVSQNLASPHGSSPGRDLPLAEDSILPASPTNITPTNLSASPAKPQGPLVRRSSDSDIGTPPKGSSLTGSSGSGGGSGGLKTAPHRPFMTQHSIDIMSSVCSLQEYPFFTVKTFPPGFVVHLGGVVSARSVKLLDRIHNPDEPETRDAWWMELRTEVRSHARAMGCHAVIGYSEHTTICDEIIVLSACGTAAIINTRLDSEAVLRQNMLTMSLDRQTFEKEKDPKDKKLHVDVNLANRAAAHRLHDVDDLGIVKQCSLCHIPYNESSLPFPVNLAKCAICKRYKVPDVLFTTIEPPVELTIIGKGTLVQARLCRGKKEAKGETNAKEISDNLPFMEYELHKQLLNKLKVKGMNCLFGLKIQVVVGERFLVALASATAVYCAPLPAPPLPKIIGKMESETPDRGTQEMQKRVTEAINRNKDMYNLFPPDYLILAEEHSPKPPMNEDFEEGMNDIEFCTGSKDTFVLEIDDAEDAEIVWVLLEPTLPDGFDICTTETMPGVSHLACSLQMFTRVWRGELRTMNNRAFNTIFDNIIRSLLFKLRAMTPCCLCHVDFDVELHDEDDMQVSVTGTVLGLGKPPAPFVGLVDIASEAKQEFLRQHSAFSSGSRSSAEHEDLMFHMDEVSGDSNPHGGSHSTLPPVPQPLKVTKPSKPEKRLRYYSGPHHRQGVELTPLPYISGAYIEQYLGHLNFFIIRETTSVRESGGLNGFMHGFLAELMAICRAHVAALGGNALIAFKLSECVLDDNLHKNQSQSLVNVCGDVVQVMYEMDLQMQHTPGSKTAAGVSPGMLPTSTTKSTPPKSSPRYSPKADVKREMTGSSSS